MEVIRIHTILRMVVAIKVDIVGGSISGLSTAISLKQHDSSLDVIVHEKYKTIGYNHEGRRCGEAHTVEWDWAKWKPNKKSIFNEILTGEVYVGKKHYVIPRNPGTSFILNRQEFICQLARDAEKHGVTIQTEDKIKSVHDLNGTYIVDASGCPSTIKRELGLDHGMRGMSYQQTVENSNWFFPEKVKIFFTEFFGYFWVFPRTPHKKEINVGVGTFTTIDYNMKDLLKTFREEHHIDGTVNYTTGGLVPAGLQYPLRYKNILFVGDAGVGTFPLTGQGIYRALISGDIAGACIAQKHLENYSSLMYKKFMKWEVIGKAFLRMNFVFRKIGPAPVLKASNLMVRFSNMSH